MAVDVRWWHKYGCHEPGSRRYNAAAPAAESNYKNAVNVYHAKKSIYDKAVVQASALEFPSVTFDNLVSKVNDFLIKLVLSNSKSE
jgi:hypothetical protein